MKWYRDLASNVCLVLLLVAACNGQYDSPGDVSDVVNTPREYNPNDYTIDSAAPNSDQDGPSDDNESPISDDSINVPEEPSNNEEPAAVDDFVNTELPVNPEDVPIVNEEQPDNENLIPDSNNVTPDYEVGVSTGNEEEPPSEEVITESNDVESATNSNEERPTTESNDLSTIQEGPSTANEEPSTETYPSTTNDVQPPPEGPSTTNEEPSTETYPSTTNDVQPPPEGPSGGNEEPPQVGDNNGVNGANNGSLLPTAIDGGSHDHGHGDNHHGHGNDHGHNPRPKCNVRFGYMEVAGSCDSYIECRKGRARKRLCPDGMYFNKKARWSEYPCGYPSDIPCAQVRENAIQKARPTPLCRHQYGFFPIVTEDIQVKCSQYIMCSAGIPHIMNCSISLVFNPEVGRCDWPEKVKSCRNHMGFICPQQEEDYLEEDPLDSTVQNYKYEGKCSYFWSCMRGHARLLRCDYGMYFDHNYGKCIVDQNGVCGDYNTPHESDEENGDEHYRTKTFDTILK